MNLKKHLNSAIDEIPGCVTIIISVYLIILGITLETVNDNFQSTIIAKCILIFVGMMLMIIVKERDEYKKSKDEWKESFDFLTKLTLDYLKKKRGDNEGS